MKDLTPKFKVGDRVRCMTAPMLPVVPVVAVGGIRLGGYYDGAREYTVEFVGVQGPYTRVKTELELVAVEPRPIIE